MLLLLWPPKLLNILQFFEKIHMNLFHKLLQTYKPKQDWKPCFSLKDDENTEKTDKKIIGIPDNPYNDNFDIPL